MAEIDTQTRTERLAGQIADAIIEGALPPGSRLDEQGLADRYGVSRTPVREALRQLGTTGLIDIRPRRGAIVSEITHAQLQELFVAMGELEATCARLCAISMTPIERRGLEALHESMQQLATQDQARDPESYVLANVAFHSKIYSGSHNAILADMASTLRRRLSPYRRAQFRSAGRLQMSYAEHQVVVAAIIRGDAETAHSSMLRHVSFVEDAVEKMTPVKP